MKSRSAGNWVLICLLCVFLGGCSRSFFIKLDDDFDSGARFCFYRNMEDVEPQTHRLRRFGVQVKDGDGWTSIWSIRGEFSVECLVYGEDSDAYETEVSPEPMEEGVSYRAGATDSGYPIGYASVHFTIDESGQAILQEYDPD